MKRCPRCQQVYYDDNQNFCLNDGETLQFSNDTQPTLVVDTKAFMPPTAVQKQGVNPIFAYLSVGLLCLLVGGGIVALIFFNPFNKPSTDVAGANSPQKPSENTSASNKTAENSQTSTASPPPQTPLVVKVPVPVTQSKTKGYKNYTGNVGGDSASFDLVWNNDKSISGSYYFNSNPNIVYTVSGSNYAEGNSQLRVTQGANFVGQMSLSKTLEGSILCWQGNFSNGNQYVRFCRKR